MSIPTSRCFFLGVLAATVVFATTAGAQSSDTKADDRKASTIEDEDQLAAERAGFGRIPNYELLLPSNLLSVGVRVAGGASVEFSGVGAIPNTSMPSADMTAEEARTYSNGFVGLDARSDANGDPIPDDGKTNNWGFDTTDQVHADGTGIYMTAFSTSSDGSVVRADSSYNPGFDIELSRRLGGRKMRWGVQAGIGLSDINAKTTSANTSA